MIEITPTISLHEDERRFQFKLASGPGGQNANKVATAGQHDDRYLAAGYPIASGVIKGACRHVGKDRMERAGMHWILPGAQALLNLRCVALSDKWEPFMNHHIHQQTARLYANIPIQLSSTRLRPVTWPRGALDWLRPSMSRSPKQP